MSEPIQIQSQQFQNLLDIAKLSLRSSHAKTPSDNDSAKQGLNMHVYLKSNA